MKYNDLFGEKHTWQDTTFSELVSRGYEMAANPEDIGYEHNPDPKPNHPKSEDKFTSTICKSCPITATQTYSFLGSNREKALQELGLVEGDHDIGRYEKRYFHEVGGTYAGYNEKIGDKNCKICDYPAGCFNPDADRRDMYESQACRNGKKRICTICDSCSKGEEFIQSFCGEGTNANTKCQKCNPCPDETYKVYGCDRPNTPYDNVCIKMTTCKGKPKKDDKYDDPGNGNYYYKVKDGYRGGNDYVEEKDLYGSYSIRDLIRERLKVKLFEMSEHIEGSIVGVTRNLTNIGIYNKNLENSSKKKVFYIDFKDLTEYEQSTPDVNDEMKKNTETYPTKKLSFYNFKPFTWNNNFILNFSFTFEFESYFNDEISILDIKSSNNKLIELKIKGENDSFKFMFIINNETLETSTPIDIETLKEKKRIEKLRNGKKIYKGVDINLCLVRFFKDPDTNANPTYYLFCNNGKNKLTFAGGNNVIDDGISNKEQTSDKFTYSAPAPTEIDGMCKIELKKVKDNVKVKLFDIKYYPVESYDKASNEFTEFNDNLSNNNLIHNLKKIAKYNIYETDENITLRQKGDKKNRDDDFVNIPNPYYGKDRECSKCDTCPDGYDLLAGCSGLNDSYNAICQRKINFEDYRYKDVSHLIPKGSYYSNHKLKDEIDKLNKKLVEQDNRIRNEKFGIVIEDGKINKLEGQFMDIKFINESSNYEPVPILTDEKVAKLGTTTCSKSRTEQLIKNLKFKSERERLEKENKLEEQEKIFYRNPNNPGCKGKFDTNFIPHSKCREDGTERLVARGTLTEDTKCGECKCPLGTVGLRPQCTGTFADLDGVEGCVNETKCEGTTNNKEIYYDRPGEYKDYTRDNICKKCKKECPPGTYKLHDCKPGTSNDTMCKPHRECDTGTKENPGTMIIARTGTSDKDTVCQCIDGYDWPTDEITGEKDFTAPKCEKIKGKCYTNPCHPEANCYDNFDEGTGKFLDYVCRCDNSNGWVETEMKGKGPNGCVRLPNKHAHDIEELKEENKTEKQKDLEADYQDLDPSLFKVKNHLESQFHRNRGGAGNHIHKTYY